MDKVFLSRLNREDKGDEGIALPSMTDRNRRKNPRKEIQTMFAGFMDFMYMPMKRAIGTVMPMMKVPHGLE